MHFLPIWDYGGFIPRNILNKHFTPFHCVMPICTASYMMVDYGHAHHVF
jgi:hypothetical protein